MADDYQQPSVVLSVKQDGEYLRPAAWWNGDSFEVLTSDRYGKERAKGTTFSPVAYVSPATYDALVCNVSRN